ncbi:hypothetical protein [Kitasatospora viridis]|uniref:hypothetical protein n=1 Tax=Kitasatospora viridis TaxID=281105 RepID=UPI0011A0FF43|nr:hypothetical protein [Kitasatospora viridis]
MGWNGLWVVGALPDGEVRALRERYGDAPWDRGAADYRAELAGWSGPATDRAAAQGLADLMLGHVELPEAEEAEEACLDLLKATPPAGVFVSSARKTHPAAALCHALGPAATARLPGRFGSFLRTAAELRTELPGAQGVLEVDGARRAAVTALVDRWLDDFGDGSLDPADELLDGPLRVLRFAAATGCGAVGLWRTY